MASILGSRTWKLYTDDGGNQYGYFTDESNAEATYGGTPLSANVTDGVFPLPGGFRKRYIRVSQVIGGVTLRKQLWIGDPSVANSINGSNNSNTVTLGDETWQIDSYVGERRRRVRTVDTGQTDGDAT